MPVTAWAYPFFAFLVDLAVGDPRWIPHPVVIIGKGISLAENLLRRCSNATGEKAAGVILALVIVLPAAAAAFAVSRLLFSFSGGIGRIVAVLLFIYFASMTLALRGLVTSARNVGRAIDRQDLAGARRKLAMIVGRDTDRLDEEAILRATIETVAENLSDGFIAPLFYLIIGGLPLAYAYKAVNTLDSMVGYKNEKYVRFGWASARLDDVANYIPARITGLAIGVAALAYFTFSGSGRRRASHSFRIMRRDGRRHTSPNSGIPEAAMAGALGVRLGGPSTYGGVNVHKPYIGDEETTDYRKAASRTIVISVLAASITVVFSVGVLLLLRGVR